MKKNLILMLSVVALVFTACEDDNNTAGTTGSVAFALPSLNLIEDSTPVQIVFSEPTPAAGMVTVTYTTNDVIYGTDFTTSPEADENTINVAFDANVSSTAFSFQKLADAVEGETKNVVFTITDVSSNAQIAANATIQVNFNETASLGAALAAEVGGPNQPNQVYVDLSSGVMTSVPRVSWDLGFYSGDDFRVALNYSVKMAAKQLETTDIDAVQVADESMLIGNGTGVASQIDFPDGNIGATAIATVSDNNTDNKVYLINLGHNPSGVPPAVGSDGSGSGTHRGWKKVRVLKSGNDYKFQYADIAATTHQEVTVSKNAAYNFAFFSFTTNSAVTVEPQKNQWDINFTTFVNLVNFGGGMAPYHYADYVVNNLKGGAKAYQVLTTEVAYDNFGLANVIEANFTADQRNIGSNWRSTSVSGPGGIPVSQFVLKTDRFYVIKDPAGNIYKLKFTGGANQAGERGYPTFQYALLKQ